MAGSRFPDNIDDGHIDVARSWRGHANPLPLLLFAALMAAAAIGWLGGHPHPIRAARTAAATLAVEMPRVIRNGEFFETRIRIEARAAVAEPVVAVTTPLWRDLTVNTFIPAADGEEYKDGAFRFSYDAPLKAGDELELKIDSQINPSLLGGTAGEVLFLDGERELARVPIRMRVLP